MDRTHIPPTWMIEELRRRREEREERARIPLELPVSVPGSGRTPDEPSRSPGCVVVIELRS